MPPPRLARSFDALLLLLLSLFAGVAQAEPIDVAPDEPIDWRAVDPADYAFDNWYLETVEGQPVGYWRNRLTVEGDTIVTTYQTYRVESHGGELTTETSKVVWTETKQYEPIKIVSTKSSGSGAVTKTYRFVGDGIELTSEQNGRTLRRKLPPIKTAFLTSAQAEIATRMHIERNSASFSYRTINSDISMKPHVTTYTRRATDKAAIESPFDPVGEARLWVSTYSIFPGFEMEHWVDRDHRMVSYAYKIDDMHFHSTLRDETVTEATFDPPEMSGLSVVVPDRPIEGIDQQQKIVYELHYETDDAELLPIATTQQSVKSLGKGKARVTVGLDAKPQAVAERPGEKYLTSSIMIDHEDKVVRELAAKAVAKFGNDATTKQLAQACKRFVTRHVSDASMKVGDGTASDAARTGEGDCTECSVLLAALLRVHGIPSRCVSGLVYSEREFVDQKQVFVFHQWTQAWIEEGTGEGYWLDLDSAMWRYSAGHIALGVSAMGDDDQQDFIDIVPMQLDLKIKVIETTR